MSVQQEMHFVTDVPRTVILVRQTEKTGCIGCGGDPKTVSGQAA